MPLDGERARNRAGAHPGQSVPKRQLAEQVEERRSKYNTVLYNAKCFSAQRCTFEGLGIDPGDNEQPYWLRQREQSAAWLQTRYVLLKLTRLSNPDLHFYLLNWHGPQSGQKNVGKAINTKDLLTRAVQLVQEVGLQRLVGCLRVQGERCCSQTVKASQRKQCRLECRLTFASRCLDACAALGSLA